MLWSANRSRSAAWNGCSAVDGRYGTPSANTGHRLAMFGERVAALGEQQPHLLTGHHIPDLEAVDAGQPTADPAARRLTPLGVVAGQVRPAPMRRIQRGHLTDQVVIAVPRRQLVQAHRHTTRRAARTTGGHVPRTPCTGCVRLRSSSRCTG